jgi:hypothetical protein
MKIGAGAARPSRSGRKFGGAFLTARRQEARPELPLSGSRSVFSNIGRKAHETGRAKQKAPLRGPSVSRPRLDRPCPDDLAGGLGLEHHFLAREGVGALPCLGRGLLHHDELGKARNEKNAILLELFMTDVGHRLHDVLHVPLGKFSSGRNFFDQLRFGHLGGHRVSSDSNRGTIAHPVGIPEASAQIC